MNLMPRTNETELDFHLASLSDISKTSTQRGIDIMVVEGGGKLCLYLLRNNVRDQWPANLINNGPTPASFCLFSFFSNTNFTEKTVGFSEIRTRIVGVEGEHVDHLTTTSGQSYKCANDLVFYLNMERSFGTIPRYRFVTR